MITTIRASKRIALGGFLGTGLLFICLLAVKDMNDKLGIMTSSNVGYQKMTDSQADKIRTLTNEIESLRAAKMAELRTAENESDKQRLMIEEIKRKFSALTIENQECNVKLDQVNDASKHLESERDDLKRLSGRQKQDAEQLSVQLRDQIARLSMERDSCQRQYDAIFKLHQEAADNLEKLSNEKQRLQLQLTDASASSSTKSSKQLQIPGGAAAGNGNKLRQQQSSSIQPVGLEEPRSNHHMSTFKGGSPANVAPVGAQPPVIGGNPEVVPQHQVRKEDVMEAPKVIQHFENLDAQHDQPGLQAPVYHDSHGFDDDDIEDDGQALPQEDYENNKIVVNNQRYEQDHSNDLDYDFHSDFQPRQRLPAQPLPLRGQKVYHQPPVVIHDQHGGPRYLAPQVHQQKQRPVHQRNPVPAQFQYRRGL